MRDYIKRRTTVNSETGCWEWQLSRDLCGYGVLHFRGNKWIAHRFAYTAFVCSIPNKMLVLHKCDNPCCCNPNHLYLGTHKDNTRDMIERGRDNFTGPKGNIPLSKPVFAGGEKFPSLSAAGRYLGVSNNTVRYRVKKGWDGYSFLPPQKQKKKRKLLSSKQKKFTPNRQFDPRYTRAEELRQARIAREIGRLELLSI